MKEMVSVGLVVLSSFDHPTHLVDLDSLFSVFLKYGAIVNMDAIA